MKTVELWSRVKEALYKATEAIVEKTQKVAEKAKESTCLLYTSPSPRDRTRSRMPSSA